MKKKKVANILMAAAIAAIFLAGLLTVGAIRGWFDRDSGAAAVLTGIRGIVNLERDGVSYPAGGDTVLRAGDRITCGPGATAEIRAADSLLTLGGDACLTVNRPESEDFGAVLSAGEAFAQAETAMTLTLGDWETPLSSQTAAVLTVREDGASVAVLAGNVLDAGAGTVLTRTGEQNTVAELQLSDLSDFAIGQLRLSQMTICFTMADLDNLEQQRREAQQAQLNPTTEPAQTGTEPVTQPETEPEETEAQAAQPEETGPSETKPKETEPKETKPEETKPKETEPKETEPKETKPEETKPKETEPKETEPEETTPAETNPPETKPEPTEPEETEPPHTCTISIRCDTILDNWDSLDPAKAGYVPSDGVILYPMTVEFVPGETVFEVLDRACNTLGIQLEYAWTPGYNSYYIEGINHLYEFDCGSESGWVYCVNGGFPNYGASAYTLEDGDDIVWHYTCVGLGADVGGGW